MFDRENKNIKGIGQIAEQQPQQINFRQIKMYLLEILLCATTISNPSIRAQLAEIAYSKNKF